MQRLIDFPLVELRRQLVAAVERFGCDCTTARVLRRVIARKVRDADGVETVRVREQAEQPEGGSP